MKKVTAFVGSAHKKNTYKAVEQFLNNLRALGEVETEIVTLSDYRLGFCRGCRLCFEKGEEYCPLKDDRDVLFDKIMASDGVIFATPNYTFHMTGVMKAFIDRLGFACHRPRFFGKVFTSIVTQGFGGGSDIVKNLNFVAGIVGFTPLKGVTVTGFDPKSEKQQKKIDRDLAKLSKRYYAMLTGSAYPVPTIFQLMLFRIGRSTINQLANPDDIDYRYYADKGWLKSDYYYPARLNALKRAVGMFFDKISPAFRKMIA